MSIAAIVTRGYGTFGSIADVTTRGYLVSVAAVAATTGGGYPEDGRKEPAHLRKARRASEERRLKRLQALDDTVEAVWNKLHPSEQMAVAEIVVPDEIKPPDVRVSDLVMRPRIDFEAAIAESESYRQAIATLERMIAVYEARLLAEENDIEVLLLAAM